MLSAHHRRILGRYNLRGIEISYVRTICNVVVDLVDHFRLNNSRVSNHLTLCTRMPGGTLNKTLGARTDREEIDLSGRGLELHGVGCLCAYYRVDQAVRISPPTTTSAGTREMV